MEADMKEMGYDYIEIQEWLKTVKFKRRLFGGVSEVDVWKKIDELNALYERALLKERARLIATLRTQEEQNG